MRTARGHAPAGDLPATTDAGGVGPGGTRAQGAVDAGPGRSEGPDPAWTVQHLPVLVTTLELGEPVRPLQPDPAATGFGGASVLVRLHGHPVGIVEVDLDGGRLGAEDLAHAVWQRLAPDIVAHLAADGLPAPRRLGAEGLAVPAGHVPVCLRAVAAPARRVSVVIPTCGRPDRLVGLVGSLLAMTVLPDEILVVDNRPADPRTARAVAATFAGEARVRYLAEPRPGASRARNRGLRAATGDVVAFLDDDIEVDPGWLAALQRLLAAEPAAGCVTGLTLPARLDNAAEALFQAYGGFDRGYQRRLFDLADHRVDHPLYPYLVGVFGSGANVAFDRDALLRLGGFDARLGPGSRGAAGEDLDVMVRLVLTGGTVAYEPALLAWHHHRGEYDALRRQVRAYGVGLGALFVKLMLADPRSIARIGRRLPAGLGLLLRPDSGRNASRRAGGYPTELTVQELLGILVGPLAFARAWWQEARRGPASRLAPGDSRREVRT